MNIGLYSYRSGAGHDGDRDDAGCTEQSW